MSTGMGTRTGRAARGRRNAAAAALASGVLFLSASTGSVQSPEPITQSRPLPDEDRLFTATRENLARSMRVQNRYAYTERRTELHTNPFGRIGTGGVVMFEVTPTRDGTATYRRLLERDGKPVTDREPERQERRPRPQGRSPVEDAVNALTFAMERRDTLNGRDTIVVSFVPKPDAKTTTREGRIARVMQGTIWVDEAANEVVRAEATAIDSLSYGFGIIARLNEGTHVTLTREPVDRDVWLPTSVRITGQGRALLVRRLRVDHVIEWFDYRRVAD